MTLNCNSHYKYADDYLSLQYNTLLPKNEMLHSIRATLPVEYAMLNIIYNLASVSMCWNY